MKSAVHDSPKGSRSLLLARLRRGDFSQPKITATFQAVEDLASTGRHVDEITVAWELTRDLRDQGPGLDMNELRRDALVEQLEPRAIQTITNASMQRSVATAVQTWSEPLKTSEQTYPQPTNEHPDPWDWQPRFTSAEPHHLCPGSHLPDGGVVSATWRNRRLATVGPPEHCAVSDGLGLWFGSKSLRRVAGNPRETGVSHAQVESPRMPRMTQARPPSAAAFAVTMIHTTRVMLWS